MQRLFILNEAFEIIEAHIINDKLIKLIYKHREVYIKPHKLDVLKHYQDMDIDYVDFLFQTPMPMFLHESADEHLVHLN